LKGSEKLEKGAKNKQRGLRSRVFEGGVRPKKDSKMDAKCPTRGWGERQR